MKRSAAAPDLPSLIALRDASGVDALSDPALIGDAALVALVAAGAVAVWDGPGGVSGFVAVDGAAIHLLVTSAQRGARIGRVLLDDACAEVRENGHAAATLTLASGSIAARHYLAAGWTIVERTASNGLVLRKKL
jgi:GNAT superfamily N-acetyltransferase